jgi:hypothetical protein
MADSGITLTILRPFPVNVSVLAHGAPSPGRHTPANRERIPPAAHNSFIAFAEVSHAPRSAASGAPDFAACTVCSAFFVWAMR